MGIGWLMKATEQGSSVNKMTVKRETFFFCFLGPYPQHMEVSRLGVELELKAAGLRHSHNNTGSEPCLPPTLQLTTTPDT